MYKRSIEVNSSSLIQQHLFDEFELAQKLGLYPEVDEANSSEYLKHFNTWLSNDPLSTPIEKQKPRIRRTFNVRVSLSKSIDYYSIIPSFLLTMI